MRATTLMRCAGLALVLAVALPAPASPQIGRWVKKAIKQKIAEKVEETVLGPDSATAAAPATGTSASMGAAGAPRARKGAPVQTGPVFNEYTLEITPEVLAKLEKGLAAEAADRKAAAQELAKILSRDDYKKCQMDVSRTPEGQKAYQEFAARTQTDDGNVVSQASQAYGARLEALTRPRCGPGGSEAEDLKRDLRWRPEKTGLAASGLTEYQYSILKERIIPFCALPQPPAAAASGETRIPAGEAYSQNIFFVYTPAEVATLQGRCAALMPGLKGDQPAQQQSVAKKKKP